LPARASASTALLQLLTGEPSGHDDSGTLDLSYWLFSGFIVNASPLSGETPTEVASNMADNRRLCDTICA
jgi:hypothetical protein